jgi:hypothetical protein
MMSASESIQAQLQRAQVVQEKYTDELMSKNHVVGLAIGFTSTAESADADDSDTEETTKEKTEKQVCLVVMVDVKVANELLPLEDRIPEEIEGIPVEVQQTGLFTAGFSAE